MQLKTISLYVLLSLAFAGCLNQIDFKLKSDVEAIAINGKLSYGDTTTISVQIYELFNFKGDVSTPPDIAAVSCHDMEGRSIPIRRRGTGIYNTETISQNSDFPIAPGSFYFLSVILADGVEFRSIPDLLVDIKAGDVAAKMGSRSIVDLGGTRKDVPEIEFSISMPLVDEKDRYYKFRFERVFKITDSGRYVCYIFEDFNVPHLTFFNGSSLEEGLTYAAEIPLIDLRVNSHFGEGFYLNVYHESLSEASGKYWQQVGELKSRTGNTFEPAVGQVVTNIQSEDYSNDIFGYFYCTTEALSGVFVSAEFAGFPLPWCPRKYPSGLEACSDCSAVPGSQSEPPSFWEDP